MQAESAFWSKNVRSEVSLRCLHSCDNNADESSSHPRNKTIRSPTSPSSCFEVDERVIQKETRLSGHD